MSRLLDNRGVPIERYPWFSRDHGLKTLAKFYVDPDAGNAQYDLLESIRARIGRHKDTMADWIVAPIKLSGKYGLRDPWYTLRLFDVFLPMIAHWPQIPGYPSLMSLYKTERWLTIALRDMEERGVLLNQDFIHRWLEKAQRRTEKLTAKMNRKAVPGRDPFGVTHVGLPVVSNGLALGRTAGEVQGLDTQRIVLEHLVGPALGQQGDPEEVVGAGEIRIEPFDRRAVREQDR